MTFEIRGEGTLPTL